MPDRGGPIAVVTGGAQGIGLGIADRLLRDGCVVAIIDVQSGLPADSTARLDGRSVTFFSGDVSDESRMREIEREIRTWGGADYLVNNAGVFPRQESATVALEAWERVIAVNLIGSFICSRVFGAAMLERRRGAIVNIGSGRAFHGAPDGVAYSSSKAGLLGLTRSLALEWAPFSVRVNCVVPGLSDTAQPRAVLTEEQLRRAGEQIPLGRVGQPDDVAGAVSFLLSDEASYITGQSLAVNGGAVFL